MGPSALTGVLLRRQWGHTEGHQRPLHREMTTWRGSKKMAICKLRRKASWASSLQNSEIIHFCCLSHKVCGILSGQPEQRHTKEKAWAGGNQWNQNSQSHGKPSHQELGWRHQGRCGLADLSRVLRTREGSRMGDLVQPCGTHSVLTEIVLNCQHWKPGDFTL